MNRPDSTCGRKASCCALLKRCTSSTKTTVRAAAGARMFGALHRLADVLDAGQHGRQHDELGVAGAGHQARQRRLADARRAPQDHRVQPPACRSAARSGLPGASRCGWPITSASVRGRRRSASGTAAGRSRSSAGRARPANSGPAPRRRRYCSITSAPGGGVKRKRSGASRRRWRRSRRTAAASAGRSCRGSPPPPAACAAEADRIHWKRAVLGLRRGARPVAGRRAPARGEREVAFQRRRRPAAPPAWRPAPGRLRARVTWFRSGS